ncbi:MAG: PilZ domain-containing protein [Defluviicoccus sp.]
MQQQTEARTFWHRRRQPMASSAADNAHAQTPAAFERFVLNGQIRNISIAGVHVHVDPALKPDSPFTLRLFGLGRLEGHVAWRSEERIGVAIAGVPDRVIELIRQPA